MRTVHAKDEREEALTSLLFFAALPDSAEVPPMRGIGWSDNEDCLDYYDGPQIWLSRMDSEVWLVWEAKDFYDHLPEGERLPGRFDGHRHITVSANAIWSAACRVTDAEMNINYRAAFRGNPWSRAGIIFRQSCLYRYDGSETWHEENQAWACENVNETLNRVFPEPAHD